MKKIYRYILISVLGVMGMSSCVDNLLDRTPIASLSPTTFYQDENQCRMALMGVYSALQPVTSTYWINWILCQMMLIVKILGKVPQNLVDGSKTLPAQQPMIDGV